MYTAQLRESELPRLLYVDDFAEWYRQHRSSLVAAVALSCGDLDVAGDAVDEAMVRAFERWDRVGVMDSPQGWLYRVAVNVVRRKVRRRATERRLLIKSVVAEPVDLRPEVWAAVKALSRRQRESVALRYVLGLSEAEVAAQLGVAVGTASATLSVARSRLAVLLGGEEDMEVDQT